MRARLKVRRPSSGTLLGGLALIVAMSGVAVAAIPGANGTLTVCLAPGGALRAIDAEAGQSCPGNQQTVTLATPAATVEQAANADKLDGKDSTEFLGADGKAADSAKLDGKTLGEVRSGIDADLLDGSDSTQFLGADAQAADSAQLGGIPAGRYLRDLETFIFESDENSESPKGLVGFCPDDKHAISASGALRGDYTTGLGPDLTSQVGFSHVVAHEAVGSVSAIETQPTDDEWSVKLYMICAAME